MKSLFYGGAAAAVAGLLMGAGMKAPLAVEDAQPMAEVAGFETAELDSYAGAPSYAAVPAYTPVTQVYSTPVEDPAADPELRPAVYTTETAETPAAPAIYELAAATTEPAPANIIRSTDALAQAPAIEESQGFEMVEAPAADTF